MTHTSLLSTCVLLLLAQYAAASALGPPPGAASCSGCHPAGKNVDTPAPRLIGKKPADIVTAMTEFRTGQRKATVMDRIAKGFSPEEIAAIAQWYGAQKD
jgi:cytochrome subunit of sulfide dehydrogenase